MANGRAPAAIKVKTQTLDVNGLRAAYEWLPADKEVGFALAFAWYGQNIPVMLFKDPLDAARQKTYDRASMCKNQGDGSTYEGERSAAYAMALRKYEDVWPGRNLPKVDEALAAQPSKRVERIAGAVKTLNEAFFGLGITFKLATGDGPAPVDVVPVSVAEAEAMAAEPALKNVLAEAPLVAKMISAVTEDGKRRLDGPLFMANLPRVLDAVYEWASKGNSLAKPAKVTPISVPKPAAPTQRVRHVAKGTFSKDRVIRILDQTALSTMRGNCGRSAREMRDGMTVAQFRAAVHAIGLDNPYGTLSRAHAAGFIRMD